MMTVRMICLPAKPKRAAGFCLLLLACSGFIAALVAGADNPPTNSVPAGAKSLVIPGVHNAFKATDRIYSGSQPEGDAAFAALAALGIRTLVSVDGGKPDVAAAKKHGLRYVHLPFGYDGIPPQRVAELVKLTVELDGPFFVHCHHGLHRGPAAVAVMGEASAGWTTNQAAAWLRAAGTSPDYPGLYRAAGEFQRPSPSALAAVGHFPEITQPGSLVEAMVVIDEHFTRLKQAQKAGWKTPPGHADVSPPHEATLLWEQIKELARTDETARQPQDYRTILAAAEQASATLRTGLREAKDAPALDAAFKIVSSTCTDCHRQYRNQ